MSELDEALRSVDGCRYPENKAAIEAEIHSRKESGRYEEERQAINEQVQADKKAAADFALKAEPVIAWYLVATGGFVLLSHLLSSPTIEDWPSTIIIGVGLTYMLGTVVAGAGLLKKRSWSRALAIGLLAAQLLEFQSSTISLSVLSAVGCYVTFESGWVFGLSANFEPGFWVSIGQPAPFFLGVNLFAAWLIYLLVAARKAS